MAKKDTAVATTAGFDVSTLSAGVVPDFLKDKMGEGRGNEGVSSDDMTVPRLELVQSLSEVRKKASPNYIEGIQEGDLYNNVTREVYGESVLFVPVTFVKEYLLWRDQKQGGGFGGSFATAEEAEGVRSTMEKPEEWEVVDTPQHFGLIISESTGQITEAVVSMAKSKARVSRKFNSLVRLNGGDRFSRIYRIRGVSDQNKAGQDFFNLAIDPVAFVNEALYRRAEKFYDLLMSGKVVADRTFDGETVEDSEDM